MCSPHFLNARRTQPTLPPTYPQRGRRNDSEPSTIYLLDLLITSVGDAWVLVADGDGPDDSNDQNENRGSENFDEMDHDHSLNTPSSRSMSQLRVTLHQLQVLPADIPGGFQQSQASQNLTGTRAAVAAPAAFTRLIEGTADDLLTSMPPVVLAASLSFDDVMGFAFVPPAPAVRMGGAMLDAFPRASGGLASTERRSVRQIYIANPALGTMMTVKQQGSQASEVMVSSQHLMLILMLILIELICNLLLLLVDNDITTLILLVLYQ